MTIELQLQLTAQEAVKVLYNENINEQLLQVQLTRKDQIGDFTIVVFPLLKFSKKSPEETAKDMGQFIQKKLPIVSSYEVIKGFLNLTLTSSFWLNALNDLNNKEDFGFIPVTDSSPLMMIEYSSPNTNKPLHLGHIRNNLLGFSLSRIASVT